MCHLKSILKLFAIVGLCSITSCGSNHSKTDNAPDKDSGVSLAPSVEETSEAAVPVPGDSDYRFDDKHDIINWLDSSKDAANYKGGIMRVIAENVPDYADKLIASTFSKFIVVDKASMRVILYNKYGHLIKAFDMACAKNYGTKHKKADSRTPEGFFSAEGVYDSTDWLFTDDNGVTSKKKGQFGPRFIRIRIPGTSQIGIHGTCAPWSIGHRVSHGCIRLTNENILELVKDVEPGMPIIVLPGKRDRAVNREEGYRVEYFPTDQKYSMTETEKSLPVKNRSEIEAAQNAKEDSTISVGEKQSEDKSSDAVPEESTESGQTEVSDTTIMF